MNPHLLQLADAYFRERHGVTLEALLAPIAADAPVGKDVRANGVYRAIREARRQDDASLPLGLWEHELKRADWPQVVALGFEALQGKTKDLQLAAWSIEALIQLHGFAAVAPALTLFTALCEHYWADIYPPLEAGDAAYRANLVQWLDSRLEPLLRQLPFAAPRGAEQGFGLDAWERARRNEQLRAMDDADLGAIEGVSLQEFNAALTMTPTDAYRQRRQQLLDALLAVDELGAVLGRLCAEAPGLHGLGEVLQQALALIETELKRRGDSLGPAAEAAPAAAPGPDGAPPSADPGGPIRDRADAYARLAQAAEFLAAIEPHSPAPYLVRRAIEWGGMNTAELYHQLFVVGQGQLNIMDVLGVAGGNDARDGDRQA